MIKQGYIKTGNVYTWLWMEVTFIWAWYNHLNVIWYMGICQEEKRASN